MIKALSIAVVLVLDGEMHVIWVSAEQPRRYALLPAPQRAAFPDWAKPGRMRYARCDGGPVEVCKAFLSGWPQIREPDAILPCVTEYGDHTIEMLKRAEINWIWVTWSVGFSRESEAVQRRLVRPFVAKCHKAGIHVSAYLSLTNMFVDDMNRNVAASRNWMQLEADGSPRPYGAAKYEGKPTRIIACLNNPEWLAYCRDCLAEAIDAGVDGIFYDNCIHGCKCRLCQDAFAGYTRARCGRALSVPGVKTADASKNVRGREVVDQVESSGLADRAWTQFCLQTVADALAGHRRRADSLKPGVLVYANTHQQPQLNNGLNAIFSEDGAEPGLRGKEVSSNIGLFKYYYAEGEGYKPIRIENGRRIHADRMDGPMPPRNLMLASFEAAACQGAAQTFFEMGWTTRLARDDLQARESLAALGTANRWLRKHEALFAEVEPIAKTAVVLSAAEPLGSLVRARKNFMVLQPKHLTMEQLGKFDLVVLHDVCTMSEPQIRAVRDYVQRGGSLIATGETSLYDAETFHRRAAPGLADVFGRADPRSQRSQHRFGHGSCVFIPQARDLSAAIADWQRLEGAPLATVLSSSEALGINVARSWDARRTFVYLMNYGDASVPDVRVILNLLASFKKVRLHAPGHESVELTWTSGSGGVYVGVPPLDLFAVLEVE